MGRLAEAPDSMKRVFPTARTFNIDYVFNFKIHPSKLPFLTKFFLITLVLKIKESQNIDIIVNK